MKNVIKIAFLVLLCFASPIANAMDYAVLRTIVSVRYTASGDSIKRMITDPKKTDPKKTLLTDKNESDIFIGEDTDSYLTKQLINVASDNLGIVYRAGGTTKNGFDCSGLVYSTFKKFDITLPRSSNEMAEIGIKVDAANAKKGDLIFFINRGQHRINHVGMVVEVCGDEVKFIHSSTQNGVVISSLKESYYEKTFKQINRVIE